MSWHRTDLDQYAVSGQSMASHRLEIGDYDPYSEWVTN